MDYPISVPSVGLVGGKFIDENPLLGTPGSLIPSAWGNAVTDELLGVISAAGLAPNEANNTQVLLAIRTLILGAQNKVLVDTGSAGAYAAANAIPLTGQPTTGYVQRVNIANPNPGAATYSPDGIAARPIYGLGLQPLQGGELPAGVAVFMYLVQAGVNSGNGAWILIESLGGASQVAPATKSQHALQLGQAVGRLIGVQVFSTAGSFTYTPTTGTTSVVPEVQAAGGAGAGSQAAAAGTVSVGTGGNAGATGKSRLTAGFAGVTVVVGAGGTGVLGASGNPGGASSFGAFVSAPGGQGGSVYGPITPPTININPTAQTTATGGNIANAPGGRGQAGVATGPLYGGSGDGGASIFGAGGPTVGATASATNGKPGLAPGSGGSGAASGAGAAAATGGKGADGIVIVWEYA